MPPALRWLQRAAVAVGLFACASDPPPQVYYTQEEFDAKAATWIVLFEKTNELCQTISEEECAKLSIAALDAVLEDGEDALPLETYTELWKLRMSMAKLSDMPVDPFPKTPSEIADIRARNRTRYGSSYTPSSGGTVVLPTLRAWTAGSDSAPAARSGQDAAEIQRQQQEQQRQWQYQADQMRRQTEQQNRTWCTHNAGTPACVR